MEKIFNKMNKSKQRILQFIEYQQISKREFCKKISVSHTIFNTNGAIGSDKLELINSIYPNLNIEWVVSGKGKMLKFELKNEEFYLRKNLDFVLSITNEKEQKDLLNFEKLDLIAYKTEGIIHDTANLYYNLNNYVMEILKYNGEDKPIIDIEKEFLSYEDNLLKKENEKLQIELDKKRVDPGSVQPTPSGELK